MEELGLPEGVTQEQVDAWKKEYKKVKTSTFKTDDGQDVLFILARPTRVILDMWNNAFDKGDRQKARDILKTNCIKFGDKKLLDTDVNLETSVLGKIQGMLEEVQAIEKEL